MSIIENIIRNALYQCENKMKTEEVDIRINVKARKFCLQKYSKGLPPLQDLQLHF